MPRKSTRNANTAFTGWLAKNKQVSWAKHLPRDERAPTGALYVFKFLESDKLSIMQVFSAPVVKLGINACVNVPEKIVKSLLAMAGKKSAPVQVKCLLNGVDFEANVVCYSGDWRLYLNLMTRKSAGCNIGDKVKIHLAYDPSSRMPPMPEPFRQALRNDPDLQKAWRLRPSAKRREILEFLNDKKSDAELACGIAETVELLLKKR